MLLLPKQALNTVLQMLISCSEQVKNDTKNTAHFSSDQSDTKTRI